MKVIISRKGFDSEYGGNPSPILPDGTMISFPIPEDNTGIYYKDLWVNKNLSYLDLMNQLGLKKYNTTSTAHLDPDINKNIKQRNSSWDAIFGQNSSAASHLNNQGVGVGDVFLFFGWFKNIIQTSNGYKYDPNDKKGKYVLWGYLEIGQKIAIDSKGTYPTHYLTHPHFKNRKLKTNTAFIASKTLSFNSSLSGAGVFMFNENLVLSDGNSNKSKWNLPIFFHPSYGTSMTYHGDINRWEDKGYYCTLECVGKGQEFVVSGNPFIEQWANELIKKCAK